MAFSFVISLLYIAVGGEVGIDPLKSPAKRQDFHVESLIGLFITA
jgi:hypothetical protein